MIISKKSLILSISVFGISVFIITFILASYFFKVNPNYSNPIRPIVYPSHSQISIDAENWFRNYNRGFTDNGDFVVQTCNAIAQGYYTFEWDYKTI